MAWSDNSSTDDHSPESTLSFPAKQTLQLGSSHKKDEVSEVIIQISPLPAQDNIASAIIEDVCLKSSREQENGAQVAAPNQQISSGHTQENLPAMALQDARVDLGQKYRAHPPEAVSTSASSSAAEYYGRLEPYLAKAEEQVPRNPLRLVEPDVDAQGRLKTPLGKLSPPRTPLSLFHGRKVIPEKDYAIVQLSHELYQKVFQSVSSKPESFTVHAINPATIARLSLPNIWELMELLAETPTDFCAVDANGHHITEKHYLRQSSTSASTATVMAAAVALRGGHALFAELLAGGLPETVDQLEPFCRPPFLTLDDIPLLVHGAARHMVHHHHGHSETPSMLASSIGKVTAHLLQSTNMSSIEAQRSLGGLLAKVMRIGGKAEDKGVQLALLMIGVKQYVAHGRESVEKNFEGGEVFVNCILGGLAGFPPAAIVAGALAPAVGFGIKKSKDKKAAKWDRLQAHVNIAYGHIKSRIFVDGKVTVQDESKTKTIVTVDSDIFCKYCEAIFDWTSK